MSEQSTQQATSLPAALPFPARTVHMTFQHLTVGDDLFWPMIGQAVRGFLEEDPCGSIARWNAPNGVIVTVTPAFEDEPLASPSEALQRVRTLQNICQRSLDHRIFATHVADLLDAALNEPERFVEQIQYTFGERADAELAKLLAAQPGLTPPPPPPEPGPRSSD